MYYLREVEYYADNRRFGMGIKRMHPLGFSRICKFGAAIGLNFCRSMVEYITAMKYIDKYLKPNMRVLEIGAATGRYSHALAQKGYRVDAVELVEHNIEIFK